MSAKDLGPLFGGRLDHVTDKARPKGPPSTPEATLWVNAEPAEHDDVRRVIEALNAAKARHGMPHQKGKVRLGHAVGWPVLRRLRELREDMGQGVDVVAILCGCVDARVAKQAAASGEPSKRGDYANTRSIFSDDERWPQVLNAGQAWVRGQREVASKATSKGRKSHAPSSW